VQRPRERFRLTINLKETCKIVFALFYKAYRYLIRVAFIFLKARKLKAYILIVLPKIIYTAISSRGKVSASYFFSLA
jgi:hypothetical protein